MSTIQVVSRKKLKEMLEQRNFWSRMLSGKLQSVEQYRAPAKKILGGTSYIISYYDEHSRYVFTIHKIQDKNGRVRHRHAKNAIIDGVRYKATEK
jgi:hypothetical protein